MGQLQESPEGVERFPTLKARMSMMPGMEAMRMSQRHPMVGMTTEARPMMSREPASQKTCGESCVRPPHQGALSCPSPEPSRCTVQEREGTQEATDQVLLQLDASDLDRVCDTSTSLWLHLISRHQTLS